MSCCLINSPKCCNLGIVELERHEFQISSMQAQLGSNHVSYLTS